MAWAQRPQVWFDMTARRGVEIRRPVRTAPIPNVARPARSASMTLQVRSMREAVRRGVA